MNSCIYEGWVGHRRQAPVRHVFRYRLFMLYLDLDELETVFAGRWLWSTRRPALAWFRRRDHLGDPRVPLATAVRDLVEREAGTRPRGPVRLLTHLRYAGYCMNPVSFYYCFEETGRRVEAVVAEVENTPWGERHCYVLDAARSEGAPGRLRFRFPKAFHVSPFMGMDQRYDWRLSEPRRVLSVHMDSLEADRRIFDATMVMLRRPITRRNLRRVLVHYPFMTAKIVGAIYLHALRLWMKRVPFHPHPRHRRLTEESPS